MNCKNCDQPIDGNFCANCGQRTTVGKINFSNVVSEISGSIFHMNKGLFFTIKELFVRPGHSIREYIEGKRKNHFKPISYALTISTIYFIVSQLIESQTMVGDAFEGFLNGWTDSNREQEGSRVISVFRWFVQNYAYTVLLLLPFYSLASYLAFLKTGYNYLEHLVLNAFIIGQQAFLYMLLSIPLIWIDSEDLFENATILTSMAYTFVVFWQFFSKQSRIEVILRSVLNYVLSILLIMMVLGGVFAALKVLDSMGL